MQRVLPLLATLLALGIKEVSSSGVFELKLQKFENIFGGDSSGLCCDSSVSDSAKCNAECLTSFRVCLKHYQVLVDTQSPCTYGDIHTPVLGDKLINQDYLLSFPFNFTWTGTFSLIVEAWHDFNSTTPGGRRLLARHTQQQSVHVGPSFVPASYSSPHLSLHYEYRVTCLPHYYGSGCEVLCRPRDDSFGHFVCDHEGLPKCLPGWEAKYCTKPRCLPGCDSEHGHCTRPGECQCKQGWSGERCDQCLKHPGCDHGTCNRPWECLCEEGWGGLFCNQDLNYCTNHRPCKNGGTCFNTGQGLFTCSCPDGYTGKQCETYLGSLTRVAVISSCAHLGCFNAGTCDLVSGSCRCREGFSGSRCEVAGPCARQPCLNGGVCSQQSSLLIQQISSQPSAQPFKCKCPLGFSGPRCENRPLDCDIKQCLNGGECISRNGSRLCDCINGHFGKFCENTFRYCDTKPCQNHGTCIDLEQSGFKCLCQYGFTGDKCENSLREFSEISRQISENEALLVSELHGLSSLQIIIIVIISVLIPLIALIGALTVILLKRRRELERKKCDALAKLENEANMVTSGHAKEPVMIHNMLRFGNDTKFINNFENEYATISHSVSDTFYETASSQQQHKKTDLLLLKKPLNTNNCKLAKDMDKRLSRISIDSNSTSNTAGNISSSYISDTGATCKQLDKACLGGGGGGGPSTSAYPPNTTYSSSGPIYQSGSSCSSISQSIYMINDNSFQLDDAILPPGFFATEV